MRGRWAVTLVHTHGRAHAFGHIGTCALIQWARSLVHMYAFAWSGLTSWQAGTHMHAHACMACTMAVLAHIYSHRLLCINLCTST